MSEVRDEPAAHVAPHAPATLLLGEVSITAITDGAVVAPRLGELFPTVPAEQLDRYRDYCDPDGRVLGLHIGAFVVRLPDETILVDAGFGWYRRPPATRVAPGALLDNLYAAGVWPEDVDRVLITHLHPDHIGWLMVPRGAEPVATFPKARYEIYEPEWRAVDEGGDHDDADLRHRVDVLCRPLLDQGRLDLVPLGHRPAESMRLVPTPGHSPGHVCFEVTAGGASAILIGDAMHTPLQVAEPAWPTSFDIQRGDPDQARVARDALLDLAERHDSVLVANHFPFPGFGRIVRDGDRRAYRAL